MLRKIIYLVVLLVALCSADLHAQLSKISTFKEFKPVYLVDMPTANILTDESTDSQNPAKYFLLTLRVYKLGGMNGGLMVGLTRHLMFGVSYGGQNLIGEGKINWNPSPGISIRYKLFSEKYVFPPEIAIGYDSQGWGSYDKDLKRYEIKSPGLYLVASKNYSNTLANLGFHGGFNYSQENQGGDKDLNLFLGAHLILEEELSLVWEYDFGTNDNDEQAYGAGKGYMNVGIRWLFANQLILEFSAKNLLNNKKGEDGKAEPLSNREMKIIYRQKL